MKEKTFSTGGCRIAASQPKTIMPTTFNLVVSFEEALKLKAAVDECCSQINRLDRSTATGKRAGMNICVHLKSGGITINQRAVPKRRG